MIIIYILVIVALVASLLVPIIAEKYENYAVERPVEYFKTILDKHTKPYAYRKLEPVKDLKVSQKVAAYISTRLFNSEYDIVKVQDMGSFVDNKTFKYVVFTHLVLHRQDKMYAISIKVGTLHDLDATEAAAAATTIIRHDVTLVSQDTVTMMNNSTPLGPPEPQVYSDFEKTITKGSVYEKQFLDEHYAKIKRYRGITVE